MFQQFLVPEEFKVELLSEKVDVFSLGNAIYCLVVFTCPFDDMKKNGYRRLINDGILPSVTKEYRESDNSIDRALLKAMNMCVTTF